MDIHFGCHKVSRAGKSTRELSLKADAIPQGNKAVTPRCQEKPLRRSQGTRTVNRTHVDEMSILRRSGEGLFRNSAN